MATQQQVLNAFEEEFLGIECVSKVSTYKNVVYIDIATANLKFAVEFDNLASVEIVFRDDATRRRFSRYFMRPFGKGTLLIKDEKILCDRLVTYPSLRDVPLADIARSIIEQCLKVEGDLSIQGTEQSTLLKEILAMERLAHQSQVMLDFSNHMQDRMLGVMETVAAIRDEELSVARFGDGEIKCMVTEGGTSFQKHNWFLMQELRDMSMSNPENLLVCYPSLMPENGFWQSFWEKNWAKCRYFIRNERIGDSFITRPQAFHIYGKPFAELWKTIWDGKNVCFVTGEVSRMNAGHTIFSNLANKDFVYSKSTDAYEDLDSVVAKCRAMKNVDMFLIALGPAGTALAYRLDMLGYRALDIGHLNNSYDNAINKAPRPESLRFR